MGFGLDGSAQNEGAASMIRDFSVAESHGRFCEVTKSGRAGCHQSLIGNLWEKQQLQY